MFEIVILESPGELDKACSPS